MQKKIKNFFGFLRRAWCLGYRGKIGVLALIFATITFVGIFFGQENLQHFIINIWRLNDAQQQLMDKQAELEQINHHIKLLENYSPDYVEELGLQYLNIGDPKFKVLKI